MKKLLSLVLALMMVLSLTSFSAAEEVTLIFMNQAAWNDQMQAMCDRYYELTGVKVVLENYSFNDLMNTVEVKIGTGSKDYDVLSLDVPNIASYARRGMVADLSPYFTEEDIAKLVPAAVNASTYEGKLYASPLCNSTQELFYNTALLEEADFDMSEFDNYSTSNRITWERVAEIARQVLDVIDPDGSKGILGLEFNQVDRVYQMNQLPNSMGGAQVSEDGYSLDGVLNTDAWVNALTWYQDQVKAGICSRGISASETGNYFYSNKCVFQMNVTNMVANCERNGMTTLGFLPSPCFAGMEDKVATPTGSWHFGVNAYSQHIDEAAAFVKWLTCSDEGPEMFYNIDGMIPTYVPLLDKLSTSDDTAAWMKLAIEESKTTAYPRAVTPAFNEYSAVLNALWSDVRNGEDVQECIDYAIESYADQCRKYIE